MMTLTTCGFHGTIRPSVPGPYIVRCLTCRAVVAAGEDGVDVDTFSHQCPDTSSATREFEVTFYTAVKNVELSGHGVLRVGAE